MKYWNNSNGNKKFNVIYTFYINIFIKGRVLQNAVGNVEEIHSMSHKSYTDSSCV